MNIEKRKLYILTIYTFLIILLLSCKSIPKEVDNATGFLYTGDAGRGMRLAVLQPNGINIPQNQEWLLSMIQGSLTTDFNIFSKMTILDRQHLDDILAEQQLSLNGNFSDDDYVKIGNLTNTQYILIGSLSKITANNFLLNLSITNIETGQRLASFGPKQYTLADIQGMIAIKEAAYELMLQTGVEFTETGKRRLFDTAQTSIHAETALAKGITAEKSGATLVEVMQYYYQAVDYDYKMTEAIDRLASANKKLTKLSQPITVVRTGNIREDAMAELAAYRIEQENKRIDEENKQVWIQQLKDCESYFEDFFRTANASLEFLYSPNITQAGDIDKVNETISLRFEAVLLPLEENWFKAAQQTIEAVRKGLMETGRAEDWGLANWPQVGIISSSIFIDRVRKYNITFALLDENENTISNTNITLNGGWGCTITKQKSVSFTPTYDNNVVSVVFKNIKISNITDTLSIRILTINDQDIETASENGVLAITSDNKRLQLAINNMKNEIKLKESSENFSNWVKGVNTSHLFVGYVYTPEMPFGLLAGYAKNRLGIYGSLSITESSGSLLFGIYLRTINYFFIDAGIGTSGDSSYYNTTLSLQIGLLYSFKYFYLSAGYRHFIGVNTPTFFVSGGLNLAFLL